MDAIDQCKPSTTPGPSSPIPPALLEACQISSDGNAYRFRTFRYYNLRDATRNTANAPIESHRPHGGLAASSCTG